MKVNLPNLLDEITLNKDSEVKFVSHTKFFQKSVTFVPFASIPKAPMGRGGADIRNKAFLYAGVLTL